MKHSIIVFLLALFPLCSLAQTGNIQLVLSMVRLSLNKGDTLAARDGLAKIASQCESSDQWQDRYGYYIQKGFFEKYYRKNLSAAADAFHKAYESYPTTEAPDQEFLSIAWEASEACEKTKQYKLGEDIAADALFRASDIVDSCVYSAALFSLLAEFYEQRGDTIMPQHFHQKSQDLSIRNWIVANKPDSVEIYNKRLENIKNQITFSKAYFSKASPNYLYWLATYLDMVYKSGNNTECEYLGKMILKTARDSLLANDKLIYNVYVELITSYVYDNKVKALEEFLPDALSYYALYPEQEYNTPLVYYWIGYNFTLAGNYTDALHYLRLAKDEMQGEQRKKHISQINRYIKECEEHI